MRLRSARIIVALALGVFALLGMCACTMPWDTGDAKPSALAEQPAQSETPGAASSSQGARQDEAGQKTGQSIREDGSYTSRDEVAAYIHQYGHLPKNFIGKKKARDAGWVASEGNLQDVCPGKSIGGSRYYNDDGALPDARGRTWTECDIDYHGGHRGPKRIVFSNDGLVYYTSDHYQTFTRLY